MTGPLPKLPASVRLPDYGGMPRFTRLDDTDTWFVVGPDSVVRAGYVTRVELFNGTHQQVQVDELVAERTVQHRADRVRHVAATVVKLHDQEFCRPCSGRGREADGSLCLCECHGRTLIEHVFDSTEVSPHTYEGRIVHALRHLAQAPLGRRKADVVKAVDQAIRALTGSDYDEFADHIAALKTQKKDTAP
jgi:hypothetical protein